MEERKGSLDGPKDPLRLFEFHLRLRGMNIHIDGRGRKGEKENHHRKFARWDDMTVGIEDSLINHSVSDKSSIDI
jgi:hypothetical protein